MPTLQPGVPGFSVRIVDGFLALSVVDNGLSFWISMAPCVGLSAQDTHDLHWQSLNVNHARQDGEYSMKTKTETDNKTVTLGDRP